MSLFVLSVARGKGGTPSEGHLGKAGREDREDAQSTHRPVWNLIDVTCSQNLRFGVNCRARSEHVLLKDSPDSLTPSCCFSLGAAPP